MGNLIMGIRLERLEVFSRAIDLFNLDDGMGKECGDGMGGRGWI